MYHTCLHCTRDLGRNDVLEALPIGRRIAFDPARGRLWVICRSCAKWNLVPFDNRLEAIDVCQQLFHDTRKRFSTDNIGLARMPDGTDLVRIGEPQRPEFASWRYGAQYKRRRMRQIGLGVVGGAGSLLAASMFEFAGMAEGSLVFGMVGLYAPILAWEIVKSRRRAVRAMLPGAATPVDLHVTGVTSVHLSIEQGNITLDLHRGFWDAMRKRTVSVSGPDVRLVTRRILASLNAKVGSNRHLSHAVGRIETGNIEGWLRHLDQQAPDFRAVSRSKQWRDSFLKSELPTRYPRFERGVRIAALPPGDRLAIEMWLSEEDEARALAGELALLERQWREAEELAAIADRLSLPAEQTSL